MPLDLLKESKNENNIEPFSDEDIDPKTKEYIKNYIEDILKEIRIPEDQIDFDPVSGHNHDGDDSKKVVVTVDGDAIDQ